MNTYMYVYILQQVNSLLLFFHIFHLELIKRHSGRENHYVYQIV